eukprot:scaffold1017_cov374-Prasinococcus_capsulatus_cf.AAC.20
MITKNGEQDFRGADTGRGTCVRGLREAAPTPRRGSRGRLGQGASRAAAALPRRHRLPRGGSTGRAMRPGPPCRSASPKAHACAAARRPELATTAGRPYKSLGARSASRHSLLSVAAVRGAGPSARSEAVGTQATAPTRVRGAAALVASRGSSASGGS